MNRLKKYKNDLGISLLEVIFALGIMASLSPLVIKFAFKDLSDIKYLNLAKKIKQLTKSVVAYSAKTRNNWQNDTTGAITLDKLNSLHLGEGVIDKQLLDNSYIKYIKDASGEVNVYATINMDGYSLDPDKFKKTLLYVEDNIGYVVDDFCVGCTKAPCVCSINNDWAIEYNMIAEEPTQKIEEKMLAVVRVDENLLRKDHLKDFYLYRNSQGGANGNVMKRDLSLGGNDIKDIVTLFTESLFGKDKDIELIKFKAVEEKFFDNINIENSLVLKENLTMTFLGTSIVEALNIYFQYPVIFKSFSAPSAILIKDEKSLKDQSIKASKIIFAGNNNSLSIEDIVADNVNGSDSLEINGELAIIDAPHIQMSGGDTAKTKILNANHKLKIGDTGQTILDAATGQIQIGSGSVIINNIHGASRQVDYYDKITTTKALFENLKSEIQTKFRP